MSIRKLKWGLGLQISHKKGRERGCSQRCVLVLFIFRLDTRYIALKVNNFLITFFTETILMHLNYVWLNSIPVTLNFVETPINGTIQKRVYTNKGHDIKKGGSDPPVNYVQYSLSHPLTSVWIGLRSSDFHFDSIGRSKAWKKEEN